MHRIIVITILISVIYSTSFSQKEDNTHIVIETIYGNIDILLYDNTPLHKKNMIKLIKSGFYEDQLFHRVINNFMIQGGDPHSTNAEKGQRLGTGGPGYTIPAEFRPEYYHKKGALAAARQGDRINPDKESSGSQFYLVQGQVFTKDQLMMLQSKKKHSPFTPEQIETYTNVGGTPHLDVSYTVFGEVIAGLDIIDTIASLPTDNYDRPVQDVLYTISIK